jgi:cytochrome b561
MTYGTRTGAYPASSKWLHWLVAICVLLTLPVSIAMKWAPEGPAQDALYHFHKSIGPLILLLMVLRLINRMVVGAPQPDPSIERWQKAASSAVHGLLYVLLIVMPVVGWAANSAYGAANPFFGLFTLPPIVGENQELATRLFVLHRWAGFLLMGLVAMHIGAALFHHFIRRDNVLLRMWPGARLG